MKIFKRIVLTIIVIFFIWLIFDKDIKNSSVYESYENIKTDILDWENNGGVNTSLQFLEDGVDDFFGKVNKLFSGIKEKGSEDQSVREAEKPMLESPEEHPFSVHNMELGDSRQDVEQSAGQPNRSTLNEYGVEWNAYHDNYQNFFMVAYNKDDKVAGLYTNQDLISSTLGVSNGSPKELVLEKLGTPLKAIQKGWVSYQLQNNGEYDIFEYDNSYITIFYDKHENNTVTAIQIISDDLEKQKEAFYTAGSPGLEEGFEYQLFDLTNAARVVHGLSPLVWNEPVKGTARDHSLDMAKNNYFNHTNLKGQSPFDRMEEDNIFFTAAGENLAAGQLSSIFAHEGLMNSLGHRENILQADFEELGVGVAFDSESKPYYTENFLAQ